MFSLYAQNFLILAIFLLISIVDSSLGALNLWYLINGYVDGFVVKTVCGLTGLGIDAVSPWKWPLGRLNECIDGPTIRCFFFFLLLFLSASIQRKCMVSPKEHYSKQVKFFYTWLFVSHSFYYFFFLSFFLYLTDGHFYF